MTPAQKIQFLQWKAQRLAGGGAAKSFGHVVDDEGNPLEVYHGTSDEIDKFQLGHPNRKDVGWLGHGIYFTNNSDMAMANAQMKAKRVGGTPKVMSVNLSLQNPYYATLEDKARLQKADSSEASQAFSQALKDKGHDGVIWKQNDYHEYVAFHPDQIKILPEKDDVVHKDKGGVVLPADHPERQQNLDEFIKGSHLHDDGVPRRYYTGTSKDKDFSSFNVGRHGAWFTTDPKEASMYAKENDSQTSRYEKGRFVDVNTASRVIPVYLRAENPYTGEPPEQLRLAQNYKKAHSDWFDQLRSMGHDSWVPASKNGSLAVMLKNPTQIKSATGNRGTYSLNEKDITKAGGGEVEDCPSGHRPVIRRFAEAGVVPGSFAGSKTPDIEKLAKLRDKFIYHSGTSEDLANMKWGLEPQHGDWIKDLAEHQGVARDEILNRATPLVWMSDNPNWVVMKVARKLKKHPNEVTENEIRKFGHVALIPKKGDHSEHIWKVGEEGLGNGTYSDVINLNGKKAKAYETDLYSNDMEGNKEPFGVERNEYISARPVEPMFHLVGDDLLHFLKKCGVITKATGGIVHKNKGGPVSLDAMRLALLNAPKMKDGGEVDVDNPLAMMGRPQRRMASKMAVGPQPLTLDAYHGTPHLFPPSADNPLGEFDSSKIGTGEGNEAYGHGHYLSETPGVAGEYKTNLSKIEMHDNSGKSIPIPENVHWVAKDLAAANGDYNKVRNDLKEHAKNYPWPAQVATKYIDELEAIGAKPKASGSLYTVHVPDEHVEKMLDWDKPLSEQHPHVQRVVKDIMQSKLWDEDTRKWMDKVGNPDIKGGKFYQFLANSDSFESRKPFFKPASEELARRGVFGIKYLDEQSRLKGKGTRNFVVFPGNEKHLKILKREADGGIVHKANGGTIKGNTMPTLAQMKMALMKPNDISSIGAQEAPSMSPKAYFSPDKNSPYGQMPIGGVDLSMGQQGQQLMAQPPQQPQNPLQPQNAMQPQNALQPQGGPQPPQGALPEPSPEGPPQRPQGPQSNMLQMTPQGQMMGAMKPQGVASGGSIQYPTIDPAVLENEDDESNLFTATGMNEGGSMKFAIQPAKETAKTPENFTPYDDSNPSIKKLTTAFNEAIAHHLSLSQEDRVANSQRAANAVAKHIGRTNNGKAKDLLGKNAKLIKSEKGEEEAIKLPDGRGIETTGLALSPAYQEKQFQTCPNHAACKAECLGKTSGNYFKLGGGQDLEEFKGPRLNSLLKTQAFLRDPHSFAVKLHDEIQAAKDMAAANNNHLGVRLNVLSDIAPAVHESIIKAHPDVTFYDYTKNKSNPIAPNHHYTYSSTGATQPGVDNPNTNWKQMRKRLDNGDNVAMAFSHKEHLPQEIHDQETGKLYKVIDGDSHDFRPLDIQPEGSDGVIVGLKNKKATGKVSDAHKDSKGFFVHYDPQLKMNPNGTYERSSVPRLTKEGKPKIGETIPQNRRVNIIPQEKVAETFNNDGEKE
jgi:hypothetical protein